MRDEVLALHFSRIRWQQQIFWTNNLAKVWKIIWDPHQSAKESVFLWQVAYWVIATNG